MLCSATHALSQSPIGAIKEQWAGATIAPAHCQVCDVLDGSYSYSLGSLGSLLDLELNALVLLE